LIRASTLAPHNHLFENGFQGKHVDGRVKLGHDELAKMMGAPSFSAAS